MLKKMLHLTCSFLVYLSLIISSNTLVVNAEEPSLTIHQSVDEDLKDFNFNYEKYFVNPDLVYRPIIINFNESLNNEYADLLYIYDPNDLIEEFTINYDVAISSDNEEYSSIGSFNKNIYSADVSSDGLVKRFIFNGYDTYRNESDYREYTINKIGNFKVNSIYRFGPSNTVEYSNSLNMYLEDPHNWSWHFDEDNWWQNVSDWFSGSDVLKDQLFYSFRIPDGWDVNQIESIDIQYKKALLEGYRATIADNNQIHNYYKNDEDEIYKPIFYGWNSKNSDSYLDKSNVLGNSVYDIGNKVDFTFKTLEPSLVTSNGGINRKYKWNRIQHVSDFKKAFGEKSDIYNFVSSYYVNEDEDYWIINYDDFYYSYQHQVIEDLTIGGIGDLFQNDEHEENDLLINYLISNGNERKTLNYTYYYDAYKFTEEYTFDISARYITYRDSLGIKRSAAVSVAPVMEKEGSGGTSNSPFGINDDFLSLLSKILAIFGVILFILLIIWIVDVIISKTSQASLNKNLKEFNESNKKLFKDKPKK